MVANLNLPFPSPMNLPVPRRFAILGISAAILVLFLHTFLPSTLPPVLTSDSEHHEPDSSYFSPSKWLPPILNPKTSGRPVEFDEDGQCVFLSPFDALSSAEKARAAFVELEEVSSGVVRSKPLSESEEFGYGMGMNETGLMPTGLTHPVLALLRDGEVKWQARMARQSKTLEEAVEVYKERWGRPPPLGFDNWCAGRLDLLAWLTWDQVELRKIPQRPLTRRVRCVCPSILPECRC